MGLYVELVTASGQRLRQLPDPSGGTFDAAGDFDAVFDTDAGQGHPSWAVDFPLLASVDAYGDTTFGAEVMDDLIVEIERVHWVARQGREHRGLERLKVLAYRCRDVPGTSLRFVGD